DDLVTGVQTCALPISRRHRLHGLRHAEDYGYTVIRFGHADDWGQIAARYPHIFGVAQTMQAAASREPGKATGAELDLELFDEKRSEERRVGKESRAQL